jgi:hypothetical protein
MRIAAVVLPVFLASCSKVPSPSTIGRESEAAAKVAPMAMANREANALAEAEALAKRKALANPESNASPQLRDVGHRLRRFSRPVRMAGLV